MRRNSLLLAVLAALFVALLVQASPTKPPSRPPSPASPIRPAKPPSPASPIRPPSRPPSPASPIKPPSKPVRKATKPPKTKPAAPPARGGGPSTSSSNQETAASRTAFLTQKAKCNEHATCDKCAAALKEVSVKVPGEGRKPVKARCAWQQATSDAQGKCVGIEVDTRPPSPPLHLITDKKQCDALDQVVRAHQEQLLQHEKQVLREKQQARVTQLWNAMESHVLGTENSQDARSGTHVAGAWLDKNRQDALTVERVTQLAISVQNPTKTLWLDDPRTVDNREKYPGPYFTAMDVENMCKAALIALVELLHDEGKDGRQSPTGSERSNSGSTHRGADTIHIPVQNRAFSVESPLTHHRVCITIAPQDDDANYSCYPSNTKVTTTAVGKECTNFRGPLRSSSRTGD